MALSISSDELTDGTNSLRTLAGAMSTKVVHGDECSIVVARREAGYHSRPHYHESEQLNYVIEGEMWVFVEEEGFIARAGDFFRVPANAVHWAYNRSNEPVTSFQVHSPPLEPSREVAHGLYTADEVPAPRGDSRNIAVEDDERYRRAEEETLLAADETQVS
jgi:quercetin dioxygenase-like cupin family protein